MSQKKNEQPRKKIRSIAEMRIEIENGYGIPAAVAIRSAVFSRYRRCNDRRIDKTQKSTKSQFIKLIPRPETTVHEYTTQPPVTKNHRRLFKNSEKIEIFCNTCNNFFECII